MTRQQLRQLFPDTYKFFSPFADNHPFWRALDDITMDRVRDGGTVLPDFEQMFSSMHLMTGHNVLTDYVKDMTTNDELMDFLTKLYVAYIYRNHGATLVRGDHGYDIELEIANELLALGVVRFENFDSLQMQFSDIIEDELEHAESLKRDVGSSEVSPPPIIPKRQPVAALKGSIVDFLGYLKERADGLKHHPKAKHQVLAAISSRASMPHELELAKHIQANQSSVEGQFPDISGIVLIDPTPGSERAKFIPFHGHDADIELLLNRS
ncbi:MAG: hypothetical protein CO132_02930 [Candidatus Kerfeldbacteria bacterium CG_4_9_14_3_um_filter_45_8]|nr:MAG: hypothetical protein CO132_02930 [Candidatus Kerfeldbacteria bacterium CG_4_9_14_3_um_filter_45_8]